MRWWEMGFSSYHEDTEVFKAEHLPEDEQPSIMRELLTGLLTPEEVERLEIEPGRWYLPGGPP